MNLSTQFQITKPTVLYYAVTIFVSAFFLFQVQPIIARYILPWYGGTSAVWTTCMLFFQVMLLFGYAYAHFLVSYCTPRKQVYIHITILLLSLIVLPITPSESLKPDAGQDPLLGIMKLLFSTVGLPYLMISASGPLLQAWFSRQLEKQSIYRLYAVSNFGSLLGLLSYPFLFEPQLTLTGQTVFWSFGYASYVFLCGWCGYLAIQWDKDSSASNTVEATIVESTPWLNKLLWLLLAACGSIILLASTNQITQDVAVIPFLWIVPLSLYLISFIICFDHDRWYQRIFWIPFLIAAVSTVVYLLHQDYADHELDFIIQICIYSSGMFACCMICHGELVRLKPPARQLTSFYLYIALGGALGGIFVNLLAPHLFDGFWELHIGFISTFLLLIVCLIRTAKKEDSRYPILGPIGTVLLLVVTVVLGKYMMNHIDEQKLESITSRRTFFGVLNVYEFDIDTAAHKYSLFHGRINHGDQFRSSQRRGLSTTYYGYRSGIGLAMLYNPARHQRLSKKVSLHSATSKNTGIRVGVIGLGTGTIGAYSKRNDSFRYYEINPEIEILANDYFSYLKKGLGEKTVIIGDGRISLERELERSGSQNFDVLVVDAFSGDAIPIHLLTKEASKLYWKHLNSDGILAIHITNFHMDLSPVVRVLAQEHGKTAVWIEDEGDSNIGTDGSDWVLITSNKKFLRSRVVKRYQSPWPKDKTNLIHWTDDYSNLVSVLK